MKPLAGEILPPLVPTGDKDWDRATGAITEEEYLDRLRASRPPRWRRMLEEHVVPILWLVWTIVASAGLIAFWPLASSPIAAFGPSP